MVGSDRFQRAEVLRDSINTVALARCCTGWLKSKPFQRLCMRKTAKTVQSNGRVLAHRAEAVVLMRLFQHARQLCGAGNHRPLRKQFPSSPEDKDGKIRRPCGLA
jgi:hypothetical protein